MTCTRHLKHFKHVLNHIKKARTIHFIHHRFFRYYKGLYTVPAILTATDVLINVQLNLFHPWKEKKYPSPQNKKKKKKWGKDTERLYLFSFLSVYVY